MAAYVLFISVERIPGLGLAMGVWELCFKFVYSREESLEGDMASRVNKGL